MPVAATIHCASPSSARLASRNRRLTSSGPLAGEMRERSTSPSIRSNSPSAPRTVALAPRLPSSSDNASATPRVSSMIANARPSSRVPFRAAGGAARTSKRNRRSEDARPFVDGDGAEPLRAGADPFPSPTWTGSFTVERSSIQATMPRSVLIPASSSSSSSPLIAQLIGEAGLLVERAQDLDPLDRVDRQVGLEIEVEVQHLDGIAGPLADDRQQRLRQRRGGHGCRDRQPWTRRCAGAACGERSSIQATMPRSVLIPASSSSSSSRWSPSLSARPVCSLSAPRISIRLIESIDRSASRSRSRSSISTG